MSSNGREATADGRGNGPASARPAPFGSAPPGAPPSARAADEIPEFVRSIRFRLTAIYSMVLFALVALLVFGLYWSIAVRLDEEKVYRNSQAIAAEPAPGVATTSPSDLPASVPGGAPTSVPGDAATGTVAQVVADYRRVEELSNDRALRLLREYSTLALSLMFFASLGVGWFVAGRVLAPIGRITSVARDIQATDLSQRINLRGPPDELKQLADTFDTMITRLDEAFEGQRRFIQEASHELRNPLAVIRTNLDVAMADPDPDPVEMQRTMQVVGRTASRMSRLVDDLLVYGRRGAPAHDLAPVDMRQMVEEITDEFMAPAGERGIGLVAEVVGPMTGDGPVVQGDRVALRQAAANLLANAVRLAPQGSSIRISTRAEGGQAILSVSDDGPGIPEENRNLVFQRFWRGDAAAARTEGRSGLGLAIVDQICRDHRGSVDVVDSGTGGSTFTIRLPLAPAGRASAPPG